MKYKKGAMFGLDARIALAIFGALSVISGAALYSAIQDARNTALYQDVTEIMKSYEQYYLDTGSQLIQNTANPGYVLDAGNIVNNYASDSSWSGPYYPGVIDSSTKFTTHGLGYDISVHIYYYANDTWTDINTPLVCASATQGCSIYILYRASDSSTGRYGSYLEAFNYLDQKIDNGDGALDGKIRRRQHPSTADDQWILFQGPIYQP